jgi:circadian clock protein KaiC
MPRTDHATAATAVGTSKRRSTKGAAEPASEGAGTLPKCPTGIEGFDEITGGGLPRGRPSLVCGSAGCGKTLFAVEFLVRGATRFGEPGVFISFEESPQELAENVASLGFDINDLVARGLLSIDHIRVERSEIEETGEYDLEGLFVRIGHAIDTVGAKRIVLDTIESLFSGLSDQGVLRAEIRRLFRWLKDRGVTAVITGERGDGQLTRQGLEEYVSDCVVLLDHRVIGQVSTRRLRVVKYRGSLHGTNEYPFLIDEDGISVLPVTSLGLRYEVSNDRVATGVPRLDAMLGGLGYYRGSNILLSGTAGTGKSSLAAHFVDAGCRRGERCLYFAFEESQQQIIRNMRSIGLNLEQWISKGLLRFMTSRPTSFGLEMHLAMMHKAIAGFDPAIVVVDPITNLMQAGDQEQLSVLLLRLVDLLKGKGITVLFTSLTQGGKTIEATEAGISSLMDTWLLIRDIETGGERNRGLHVLKSRGMAHSNQVREFLITDKGVELKDVYLGSGGVLTGSARLLQEAAEAEAEVTRQQELQSRREALERKRVAIESQIASLRGEIEAEEKEIQRLGTSEETRRARRGATVAALVKSRRADAPPTGVASSNGRRGRGRVDER